jgi:hypothetical protein
MARPDARAVSCAHAELNAAPNVTGIKKSGRGDAGKRRRHRDEIAENEERDTSLDLFLNIQIQSLQHTSEDR